MSKSSERFDLALRGLEKLNDEELSSLKFTMPWQINESDSSVSDPDTGLTSKPAASREFLQQACWNKFNENPQVSTAVGGKVGRLTGYGFDISSEIQDIQDVIEETELDPRNRLYSFWPKYVARSAIEGELLLCLTVHNDGFIEVDFIDPSNIAGGGEDGIIYHPNKVTMPLFYFVRQENTNITTENTILVPSIFMARYPELITEARKVTSYNDVLTNTSRSNNKKFKSLGGFNRFIVSWDKGFITKRNVSYLRTILEWLNHYENLKKYEIDHKKSAGSYLWVITMEDPKTFRNWLAMSDSERAQTGISAKKTPGSTLILPPGMKIECKNPSLPSITESDTDIFHMITSGLNEPEDITSGQSKGSFASVKASRGPMVDRTADEASSFEKFLRYDFYSSVFFLKSKAVNFPSLFPKRVAIDFKNQEPIFKSVKKRPEMLLSISFPISETSDTESVARAFLGVKHGSTFETLGIPNREIAKKMGIANYHRARLEHATEMENYPELALSVDQAAIVNKDNPTDSKNPDAKPVKKPTLIRRTKKI
jgi:hypothetical protein